MATQRGVAADGLTGAVGPACEVGLAALAGSVGLGSAGTGG
ncbi:hypothetical protein ACWD4G_04800 [Streptomyces sp. NPDC002643]